MRRTFIFAMAMYLAAGVTTARAGEVIDRILAVVNNTPLLLSDWDEAWRCEALLAGRAPESYSAAEQHEIFNRLVDQELLRQQMRGYLLPAVADEDLQARLQEVRTQLTGGKDGQWSTMLQLAGITEDEVAYHLRRQIELERFVDVRFRAGIRIEDRAITRYYNDVFLPQLNKAGGKQVPLDDVSGKIREILTQERLAEQLSSWIQTLREETEIRIPQAIDTATTEIDLTTSK